MFLWSSHFVLHWMHSIETAIDLAHGAWLWEGPSKVTPRSFSQRRPRRANRPLCSGFRGLELAREADRTRALYSPRGRLPVGGPTALTGYRSASAVAGNPVDAWGAFFNFGDVVNSVDDAVRAVRTGSCD